MQNSHQFTQQNQSDTSTLHHLPSHHTANPHHPPPQPNAAGNITSQHLSTENIRTMPTHHQHHHYHTNRYQPYSHQQHSTNCNINTRKQQPKSTPADSGTPQHQQLHKQTQTLPYSLHMTTHLSEPILTHIHMTDKDWQQTTPHKLHITTSAPEPHCNIHTLTQTTITYSPEPLQQLSTALFTLNRNTACHNYYD